MVFRRDRKLNKNKCWYMYGEKIEVMSGGGKNMRTGARQKETRP
jgi:hypothetical protein